VKHNVQPVYQKSVGASTANEDVAAKLLAEPDYNSTLPWPLRDLSEQDERKDIYDEEYPAP
jgi:hypothetical protein